MSVSEYMQNGHSSRGNTPTQLKQPWSASLKKETNSRHTRVAALVCLKRLFLGVCYTVGFPKLVVFEYESQKQIRFLILHFHCNINFS